MYSQTVSLPISERLLALNIRSAFFKRLILYKISFNYQFSIFGFSRHFIYSSQIFEEAGLLFNDFSRTHILILFSPINDRNFHYFKKSFMTLKYPRFLFVMGGDVLTSLEKYKINHDYFLTSTEALLKDKDQIKNYIKNYSFEKQAKNATLIS